MKASVSLRAALLANAMFSTLTGIGLVFATHRVAALIGFETPVILMLIGCGLFVFALELLYQATRVRLQTWRALLASGADVCWVIGSMVLLGVAPELLSNQGRAIVLAIAVIVAVFAVWQLLAAGQVHRVVHSRISESVMPKSRFGHCLMVETDVSAAAMWRIVADIGSIQRYMPSLRKSEVLHGPQTGLGATRRCENTAGQQWSERCVEFVDGHRFTVRFLADEAGFPFPARQMYGGWEVLPTVHGSRVLVWWELVPKHEWLAPILLPILAFQVDRDFPKIIQRMAMAASGDARSEQKAIRTRLLPQVC